MASIKTVLLLQPARLLHRHPVVQLLQVGLSASGQPVMEEWPVTSALVNQYLKQLAPDARKLLLQLSEGAVAKERSAISLRFDHQQTEPDEQRYTDQQMARYYMQVLGQLRHFSDVLPWYHRVPSLADNRVLTKPCQYHRFAVQLLFELRVDDAEGLTVHTLVQNGRDEQPLTAFRRYHFLLEKEDAYYQLSPKAFFALEWLENALASPAALPPSQLAQQVQQHLQEQGFEVRLTNVLTPADRLEVSPVGRVLLSELNNAFLMFTPQFVYDEWVVEAPYETTTTVKTGGGRLDIVRDAAAEQQLVDNLRSLHPRFASQQNGYFYLSFAEAQKKGWFLQVYHRLLDMNVELRGLDLLRHFKYAPYKPVTVAVLQPADADWWPMQFEVSFGKEKVALHSLQKMLLNGQKAVMLRDGSLGILGEEWMQQYAALVKHSRLSDKSLLVPRWLAICLGHTAEGEATDGSINWQQTLPAEWMQRWRQWQQEERVYDLPAALQHLQLRPYQHRGYEWLRLMSEASAGVILADDMGLGKTLQTICFIQHLLSQDNTARCLVVCPASLMYNWQQEFEKFAPHLAALVHHGAGRSAAQLLETAAPVVVTSYGTLRQDAEVFEQISFACMVADESHQIKNPAAQITRAVQQMKARVRLALSGTPVMNSCNDLFAPFQYLMPGLLGSREFFRREYAYPIEQLHDEEKAGQLQRLLAPFILRRTKQQVASDLPDKVESVLWCHMDADQRLAYESIKEQVRSSVLLEVQQKGLEKGKMSILAGLTKLRQVCNSGELVKDADVFCNESIKTRVLIEELQQLIPSHKALVFSQFTSMLDLLQRDLHAAGMATLRIDGSTPAAERQTLVNQFQADTAAPYVMLISLKAGNAGLNLTAADYVFLFDPWWNVAVENQAIDRTHRIGQQQHVFAYRMICKHTVEEKILQLKERKQKVADTLITTDEGLLQGITEADLAFLFQ